MMLLSFTVTPPVSGEFRPALIDPSGPNVGSFSITTTAPIEAVPGAGFWFDLTNFSGFNVSEVTSPVTADDPIVHDTMIYWDFGDPGTFTSPIQVPEIWKDRNVARGKSAFHSFDAPGTYTITALVIDKAGNWGRDSVQVTVIPLQTAYPGNRTILVDANNIGDSATFPGSQVVTTIQAGFAAHAALGTTGCVLLKRDGEYVAPSNIRLNNNFRNICCQSYGSGARPILKRARNNSGSMALFDFSNGTTISEIVFKDVYFQGPWDSETETGDPRFNPIDSSLHNGGDWSFYMHSVKITGFSALRPWNGGNNVTRRFGLYNCELVNFQDYGVHCLNGASDYSQNKWGAVVGTAIHQATKGCQWGDSGLGKNAPLGAWHGPLRYVDVMKFIFQRSSVYSTNSWFPNSFQPGLRLAQGADPSRSPTVGGYRIYAADFTSLSSGIGIDGQNSSAYSLPGNHILENFIIANSPGSDNFLGCGFGGTTMRNGLLIRRAHNKNVGTGDIFNLVQDQSQPGNDTARMDIHDINVINMSTDSDYNLLTETDPGEGSLATFLNMRMQRITEHAPNTTPPSTPAAPISVANGYPGITLHYAGYRRGHNKASIAIATTAPGQTLTVPYPSGVTQADINVSGLHGFMIGDEAGFYYNDEDDITFTFGASNIQILNNTANTWSGSIRLALECVDSFYDVPGFDTGTAFIPLGRQQAGSSLINAGTGTLVPTNRDLLYNLRDGSPDAGPYEGVA